jgi:hypothetical protein
MDPLHKESGLVTATLSDGGEISFQQADLLDVQSG